MNCLATIIRSLRDAPDAELCLVGRSVIYSNILARQLASFFPASAGKWITPCESLMASKKLAANGSLLIRTFLFPLLCGPAKQTSNRRPETNHTGWSSSIRPFAVSPFRPLAPPSSCPRASRETDSLSPVELPCNSSAADLERAIPDRLKPYLRSR